jgi:hypothetical protein
MISYVPPAELAAVEPALDAGEPMRAFQSLRTYVDYPSTLSRDEDWRAVFTLFARICVALGDNDLAARFVPEALDKPLALFDIGYQLIENRLYGFAATVLARGFRLDHDPQMLSELCVALEYDCNNAEAARLIKESGLATTSAMLRYMWAFHAVMSGDLATARELLPTLTPDTDATRQVVEHGAARIAQMLERAEHVKSVTALDDKDLRGWHYVLHGSVLLQLSPYGFTEGMHGRYAFIGDSPALCREGLERLKIVLAAMPLQPTCVYVLADAAELGEAAATLLDLPARPWNASDPPTEPGVVIAYDLDTTESETVVSLLQHRHGQILFAHATCWTGDPPFAADVTTYLYQTNVPPSDLTSAQIMSAKADDVTDANALTTLVTAAARASGLAAQQTDGPRSRLWSGSPVQSNAFW